MNQNKIAERVAEFLQKFPPFCYLNDIDLQALSCQIKIGFYAKDQVIFEERKKPGNCFYVLRKGKISLLNNYKTADQFLYDTCEEGDVFGIRSLFAGDLYRSTAVSALDSIVYLIENKNIQELLVKYPAISMFFAADFASGVNINSNVIENNLTISKNIGKANSKSIDDDDKKIVFDSNQIPVTTNIEATIKQAASIMTDRDTGSIIVVNDFHQPVGIITDKDLRKKVAAGKTSIDAKVSEIMSFPVITAKSTITFSGVSYLMLKHKIRHVCITVDGSNQSSVKGVISVSDLQKKADNQPVGIIKNIIKAQNILDLQNAELQISDLLKSYESKEVSIQYVSDIVALLRHELLKKTTEFAFKKIFNSEVVTEKISFFAMGSLGRNEQFVKSDQDNFLVFESHPNLTHSKVLELADEIVTGLYQIGFENCPAQMMANNEKWCLTKDEWLAKIENWILFPTPDNVLNTSIFFDFKLIWGNLHLENELKSHIFEYSKKNPNYLRALAADSLKTPPPLSFFNRFIVEKDGNHKDEFDLKARALLPFTDAARVLALFYEISETNTVQRFKAISMIDNNNSALYNECVFAFELLLKLRLKFSILNGDSGRFIPIDSLNKIEKQTLKHVFSCLNELQNLLKVKFNLGY